MLGRLIAFFLIPIYTRVFTPADLGTIALIDAAITLATMLTVLGLDNASARWFYDSPQDEGRRETIASSFWCQFFASAVVAGLLVVFAGPISRALCGTGEHSGLVRLAATVMPLGVAVRVCGGWFRYRRKAPAAAAFVLLRSLATVGLVILFVVVWRRDLPGLYVARLLAAALAAAASVCILGSWIDPRRIRWSHLMGMLAFGLPLIPAAIGAWVMTSADRFVLRIYWPQETVGLYDLAAKVASGVALAIVAFQQAWGPFAYSILDQVEARRVYARVWDVYAFFGCWLAAAVGLFAPLLLRVMATEKFYAADSCVAILGFVHLFIGARLHRRFGQRHRQTFGTGSRGGGHRGERQSSAEFSARSALGTRRRRPRHCVSGRSKRGLPICRQSGRPSN